MDIAALVIFIVGEIVRPFHLDLARVILAFDLVLFFIRVLHIFSIHRELGPKLVMIRRMVKFYIADCYVVESKFETVRMDVRIE